MRSSSGLQPAELAGPDPGADQGAADIRDGVETFGQPTEFTQLGSLDAEVVHFRLTLYRATENVPSKLTFRQRELISYLTSILNSTPHCASLSRTQLRKTGENDLIEILDRGDYGRLDPVEAALARYVHKVTLTPGQVTQADIEELRAVGVTDLEILDTNNHTAHLNYTKSVANGLGLLSEAVEEERSKTRVPGYDE